MRIGLYHGYELAGSGSNEYTRYLAGSLARAGHEVHVVCREPHPEAIPFVSHARRWSTDDDAETLFERATGGDGIYLHQLPHGPVRPVYLTDKQRDGHVKSFVALSDEELDDYLRRDEALLTAILSTHRLDVLHCNHLVCQPTAALPACNATRTPLVVYPHGSAIEYTVKRDERYRRLALRGLLGASGLIVGNQEVLERILDLYPDHRREIAAKTRTVGVGVDTSLFKPVARTDRQRSILQLMATGGGGGKPPALTEELHSRLKDGDVRSTREYWNAYDHALPDDDLDDKLRRIPWDRRILLFVGALTVGKGLQSVIAALPWVLDEHPDTHLVIVGSGAYREVLEALVYAISQGNGDLLLRLCTEGQDLDRNEATGPWEDVQCRLDAASHRSFLLENGAGIEQHVHFLGRLNHDRLRYLFPCADLAIFPSVVPEAYPLVVMEALANGVLPLVSYFSGFCEPVDGLEPLLGASWTDRMKIPVEPSTRIGTIVANFNDLLARPDLGDMGPTLRRIAVEEFDWKIRASQMAQAYRAVTGR